MGGFFKFIGLLLRFFIPSWNFFDRLGTQFKIEALDKNQVNILAPHNKSRPQNSIQHNLVSVLFNPQGNLQLFKQSIINRMAFELIDSHLDFKTLLVVENIIFENLSKAQIENLSSFRLVAYEENGSSIVLHTWTPAKVNEK